MKPRCNPHVLLLALVIACGNNHDPGKTCVPEGPYEWPAACEALDCSALVCDVTCPMGAACGHLDCTQSPQCRIDCQPQTTCKEVDCTGAESCFAYCDESAACDVTCTNARSCSLNCLTNAQCLLRCGSTAAPACQITNCPAPIDCGGGVFVCNRACPP